MITPGFLVAAVLRRGGWLPALVAAIGFMGLGASPASAIMVKLPSGRYANYQAVAGAKAPRIFDAAFTNLDYSGGPLMPSNTNYTVVWQPSNYGTHTPFQTGYVTGVNQFFADLAAASGQSTNSDAVATQYNDTGGNKAAYSSTNGGTLTDTRPLPANGCPANPGNICLTDAQLQAELNTFLAANHLPSDLTHEYFLVTPPDVASCFEAAGITCSANADVGQSLFCAYHSTTTASYIYSNIPDLAGVGGCDPFVTFCPNVSCSYNNGPADGVLSAVSHEHVESITDPQPNSAWADWGNGVGEEIGDKCNNDALSDPSLVLQDNGLGTDTPYNQTINGSHYLIQREWSNQTNQCLDSFSPNATTASASFTPSPGSGTTINFDAGASGATGGVAEYVWQFNDGAGGGQMGTIETTSPTMSHAFPTPGNYTVALTMMAADGTSNGTARAVNVVPIAPTAAFAYLASSSLEGTAKSFDATGSSENNPGGSVSSYSWTFGDGGAAAGAVQSHSYSHFGIYTVALTVTDNYGASSAVSHVVVVGDEIPTAAFTDPSPGTAGTPMSLSGSGSDPDGSISAYSWSFGDGSTGSGQHPSHAYSSPGNYIVTLAVADSDGHSAAIAQQVTVGPAAIKCVVPNVKHQSLSKAAGVIRAAHCTVAGVKQPKKKPKQSPGKHKKWALLVTNESPGAGTVKPKGAGIDLRLAYAAVHK
jgi:PKD repeat protein